MPPLRISSTTAREGFRRDRFVGVCRPDLGFDRKAHLVVAAALHQVKQVREARDPRAVDRLLVRVRPGVVAAGIEAKQRELEPTTAVQLAMTAAAVAAEPCQDRDDVVSEIEGRMLGCVLDGHGRQLVTRYTIEIEGQDKPACVAESVVLFLDS